MEIEQEEVSKSLAGEGEDQGVRWLEEPGEEGGRCNILGAELEVYDLCFNFYTFVELIWNKAVVC